MFARSRSFGVEVIQDKVDSEDQGGRTAMVGVGQVAMVSVPDERVMMVRRGGGGWKRKKEKEREAGEKSGDVSNLHGLKQGKAGRRTFKMSADTRIFESECTREGAV